MRLRHPRFSKLWVNKDARAVDSEVSGFTVAAFVDLRLYVTRLGPDVVAPE